MMMIKSDLIKISSRNINAILKTLSVSYNTNGLRICGVCPCKQHSGDRSSKSAFNWRMDLYTWICWSHHCENLYGNDVIGLIRSILGVSFEKAIRWLENFCNNTENDTVEDIPISTHKKLHFHKPLNESQLRFLQPRPKYLLDREISASVLDQYRVGLWQRVGTYMHDRVVFPIWDDDGYLVGFTGRTIHNKEWFNNRGLEYKKWIHGRYYHRFPKLNELFTGSILYNLNNAKIYQKLILVEGPIDGLKLQMAGIYNWISSLGTGFGFLHKSLLVKYCTKDLYILYDGDVDASIYKRISELVHNLFNVHFLTLDNKLDPADLQLDYLTDFLSDARVN